MEIFRQRRELCSTVKYVVRSTIRLRPRLIVLLVNCWPSAGNDGTCEVNIEYELENEGVTIHDLVISIPLPFVAFFDFKIPVTHLQ